ncbi:MAG TPA: alpha/beta fold hydrolase [Pseudonocardiaceae bacterium]
MDIILVPGLWLDGASWEQVLPALVAAGHRPHPLTLPGMASTTEDRSRITLRDHVAAVIKAIDAVSPADKVVLVGHSAGCGIAHAAVDARPDRVARAIYVGGFPTGDGDPLVDGFPAANGEVPLPDWSVFDEGDLADLDEPARAAFRARSIPAPEHVTRDPQRLSDERRYDVPVTAIATEYTTAMLRDWIAKGAGPVREFTKIRDVEYVDLPTGHWPQFTRPDDLARAILTAIRDRSITTRQFHDAEGVADWRAVFEGACAYFRTSSFAAGVALADAIGRLSADLGHHADIDLRADGVTVRLRSNALGGLTERDSILAAQISSAARDLGLSADPSMIQTIQVSIDALVSTDVMPFWRAVLGYREFGAEDLVDPRGRGPSLWFQDMDAPRPQRNRIHVDVCLPQEQTEARVAAALAAGGRLVSDHAPIWWTLADSEGNEVDVTTLLGRD